MLSKNCQLKGPFVGWTEYHQKSVRTQLAPAALAESMNAAIRLRGVRASGLGDQDSVGRGRFDHVRTSNRDGQQKEQPRRGPEQLQTIATEGFSG